MNKTIIAKSLLCLCIALCMLAIGLFRSNSRPKQAEDHIYTQLQGSVFHTVYHIQYSDDRDFTPELTEMFRAFDASVSMFNDSSIVSRINHNDTSVIVNRFVKTVLLKALEVSRATEGAFDVTCAPLVNLWGFGFKNSEHVSQQAIDSIRQFVGYQKVHLDSQNHIIKDDPRVMLDFSSIAKGYMCDVVADFLQQQGVQDYMVEIGGEIACGGLNSKGHLWGVGINEPVEDSTQLNTDLKDVMHLTDCGVATSGNYRNFYYKDGQRYAHTIDPATGYPVQKDVLSATVIAPDCMTADAFATAFMVMGSQRALSVLDSDTTLMAYFIVASQSGEGNEVIYSPRLRHILDNPK